MAELSDELLMAYADGTLDPVDRALVEAAMRRYPEYARKVDKFRATNSRIQEAFREEPGADHLRPFIELIRRDEGPSTIAPVDPSAVGVVQLSGDKRPEETHGFRRHWAMLIAASVAVLLGGGIGWFLHAGRTPAVPASPQILAFSDDGLSAQGALQDLLETVPSGNAVATPGADGRTWQLRASFTFRATSGSPCRRYEVSDNGARRFAGFACRSVEGKWLVHSHARLDTKAPEGKGFLPAAAEHDAALDAAIRASMSGDVLETVQEAQLMARRWKSD